MSVKSVQENRKQVRKETPMVVWLWVMGLGFVSYFVARITFYTFPHPIHWALGAVGAAIGFLVGKLWYRWKGDVI